MSWFTSRYTASLEQQVTELKTDKVRLEGEIERLRLVNHELIQKWIVTPPVHAKKGVGEEIKKEPPLPKVGNWLRTRSSLESTDQISELDPDKENSANGSR